MGTLYGYHDRGKSKEDQDKSTVARMLLSAPQPLENWYNVLPVVRHIRFHTF